MSVTRIDGSIQSQNTPTEDDKIRYYGTYRCQITKVFYTDDPGNLSGGAQNPQVVYEAVIVGGDQDGRILVNVRDGVRSLGGFTNYEETILRANERPLKVGKSDSQPTNQQFGDVVYIVCLNGNARFPVIIGRGTHPLDSLQTGATALDGPRKRSEYNGVFEEIDKNGNYTLTRKGGTLDATKNVFAPSSDGNSVQVQIQDRTFVRTVDEDAISETMDGKTQKMTLIFRSGLTVTVDGASDIVTIQTNGGAKLSVDGKSDRVAVEDKEGARLKISGGKVGLGHGSNEVLDLIHQMLVALQAETHIGNLGYPTSVPVNSGTYATIQAAIDAIKGGI